jgi:hypothetical protein
MSEAVGGKFAASSPPLPPLNPRPLHPQGPNSFVWKMRLGAGNCTSKGYISRGKF